MDADLLIRGGTVVDGTGAPARRADVAVRDGRIVEVADGLPGHAGREIDAAGLFVAPGFVDVHTHYDAQVFWDPALTPSCWHGVTTIVAGNCGFSIAPCRPEHRGLLARTLENVEGMSLAALEAGIVWEFETYPQYLDAIARRGTYLNFGGYVGHTAVRVYVMGDDAYERPATDDEITRMRAVVAEAVEAGALGFATSTSPTHSGDGGRPVPSRFSSAAEVEALASVLGEIDKGVFAIIAGGEINHPDLYPLQRRVGRPLTWTALLTFPGGYHLKMAELNTTQRAEGADVWPQVSCRPLVFQQTLAAPFAFDILPMFAELGALTLDERMARYADAAWREKARAALDGSHLRRWDKTTVAESATRPDLVGRTLADVAAETGEHAFDAMVELSLAERLATRFTTIIANDDPDGIAALLREDGMLLGLSDAGAHVSQLCDACMPTDLLGGWVRDRGVLTVEQAVRKLSGEPAAVFGLADRGVLRAGAAADITVFDLETVAPGPLERVYDLPAGADRLVARQPRGVAHVLVNGTPIVHDGHSLVDTLPVRPGTVVRSA